MAANTIGSWTEKEITVGGRSTYIATCTNTCKGTDVVAWTNKFPKGLDTRKKFTVVTSTDAASDDAHLPLYLYGGVSSTFALSGTTALTVTAGCVLTQLTDDLGFSAATTKAYDVDPNLQIAENVDHTSALGLKVKSPMMPYMALAAIGASGALTNATVITFYLIQAH